MVDFLVKLQEVKATEREDAVFECVLSNPFSKISWFGKNAPLEAGEKYDIEVSEDKLIHRLVVKDCMMVDKGIYAAVAGIKSCNAWLVVGGEYLCQVVLYQFHVYSVRYHNPHLIHHVMVITCCRFTYNIISNEMFSKNLKILL